MACAAIGCASTEPDTLNKAASTPLADLNLVNAPVPELLLSAQRAPYALPADASCDTLAADVRALDALLGADLDAPPTTTNPSLVERTGDLAGNALQKAAEGIIPYRGWVRKLTGAERYSRQVAAAIAAGSARRAFLKGVRAGRQCTG